MSNPATLQRRETDQPIPGPGSTPRNLIDALLHEVTELRAEVAELRADLGIQPATWLSPAEAGRIVGKPASTIKSACRTAYRDISCPDFTLWIAVDGNGRVRKVKGKPITEAVGFTVGTAQARLDDSTSDPRKRQRQSYLIRRRDLVNIRQAVR